MTKAELNMELHRQKAAIALEKIKNEKNSANLDYVAMMTDVELPEEESEEQ